MNQQIEQQTQKPDGCSLLQGAFLEEFNLFLPNCPNYYLGGLNTTEIEEEE